MTGTDTIWDLVREASESLPEPSAIRPAGQHATPLRRTRSRLRSELTAEG
ncbi:hypothetical protein [Geodermatophilus sp. SYSU D00815]